MNQPSENTLGQTAFQEPGVAALDFDALLRSSMDDLMLKTQSHQSAWGFGTEESWQLDQDKGELLFQFPGRGAIAAVQIIGTYDAQTGVWMWAWANPLIADSLKVQATNLREFGEQHGIQRLTTAEWNGQESDCWYMSALACKLSDARGAYRGPAGDTHTFMTFGEVLLDPGLDDREKIIDNFKEQTSAEFRACYEDMQAQRAACCRYFRRGAVVGLSQSELIDALALAMPSVLDTAGYPPEDAERIMGLIGEISDEEIQSSAVVTGS
ncbi:MAG TPA: hypothetical protein VHI52_11745 [Verrucomicrobiae bacterium]|nr:hypothetical protein [Verrucomicrobiae bacterium]